MPVNTLDFTIFNTNNCKTLGVIDTSIYTAAVGSPILTITRPGFASPVIVNFVPKQVNVLNSNNLLLTSVSSLDDLATLPDGIYCITYSVRNNTGDPITKNHLRTCKLVQRYENAILNLDILECCDNVRKKKLLQLFEIEFMIESAIASANICNIELAMELYNKAQKLLDYYQNQL